MVLSFLARRAHGPCSGRSVRLRQKSEGTMTDESDGVALAGVREALAALLPGCVAVAVWGLDTRDLTLMGSEEQAVARAVETRREEFARGRACARSALRALGGSWASIGVGPGRQPLWPRGFVGSITHGAGVVAAAAASLDELSALGIDVEPLEPLPDSVRRAVVQPEDSLGRGEAMEKVVFSAKESVFKALFPAHEVWIDFDAVFLEPGPVTMALRVQPTGRGPIPSEVKDLRGGYRIVEERVVTAFWKSRSSG